MNTWFQFLVSNSLLASVLALVVVFVSKVWRRPRLLHALWIVVLLKFVTPPFVTVAIAQRGEDTQIILLNVVEVIPAWVASQLPAGVLDQSRQSTLEDLEAIAGAANIKVDVEVRAGHPYKTILEMAEKTGAELIIIASHQPGLEDYFLGSTAAKVVRHAQCSVLVVR